MDTTDCEHRHEIQRVLAVPCPDASRFLQPADRSLDDIASSIQLPIELILGHLVASLRDDRYAASRLDLRPYGSAAVPLVGNHIPRAAQTTTSLAPDRDPLQQCSDVL